MENNSANILSEENHYVIQSANNNLLKFFSKTKKIIDVNNKNQSIKIYVSNDVMSWYGGFINLFVKLFNKTLLVNNYDNENLVDVVIFNKHDRIHTSNNNNIVYICLNGEKSNIEQYCDIGILTTKNFIHPYSMYFPQMFTSLWERRSNYKNVMTNTKEKFCAYMYSYDLQYRVELFNFVSKYKQVDGLGNSCNTMECKQTDRNVYNNNFTYNDLAIKKYSKYKFVLALENGIADGYITEKLINPIIAGSIPIYAGPQDAFDIINKKRVIYIYDFENYEKMLDYIKLVDTNDELYNSIIQQDIFVGNLTWDNFEQDITNKLKKAFGFEPRNILIKQNFNTNKYYTNKYDAILNYDYINIPHTDIKKCFGKFINSHDNVTTEFNYKLEGVSHIAWINLDRAQDRFLNMNEVFKNISIPNTRIKAIDGKFEKVREMILPIVTDITDYEIACTLSHIKALSHLSKLDGEYFMVCEDDLSFNNMFLMGNENIKSIIAKAPQFDILLVNKISLFRFHKDYEYYSNLNKTYNADENIYGTGCYIVSRNGINKILNKISYDFDTDKFFINDNNITPADYYLYVNTNTCVYKYNFIDTQNVTSYIHVESMNYHLNYHTRSSNFQLQEIRKKWS